MYLPRVLEDGGMTFLSIDKNWITAIEPGPYGIQEPNSTSAEPYDSSHAPESVVVIPGLAFDTYGHRLGRGRGAYDSFLGKTEMLSASKLGVCWSLQLVKEIPTESHDIAMDFVCHERGYFGTLSSSQDGR